MIIKLQQILFPSEEMQEHQLYYKCVGNNIFRKKNSVLIGKNTVVDFGTYFNSFSIEKWLEYTNVDCYRLALEIKGSGKVQLYHSYLDGGTAQIEEISEISFRNEKYDILTIDLPACESGIIGFRIQSFDEDVKIKDAYYYTENVKTDSVNLALAFTTYKREAYITENVKRLLSLNDERIHIHIVDNAGTLELEQNDKVTVYTNLNSGGAGGFSRNMIEIINSGKEYTHVILMDDDVTIDPRVFERLIAFLSVVKDDYKKAVVGGAMFRTDKKYFHVESGAKWGGTVIYPYRYGLDMRELSSILHTATNHYEDYNAWWFCCVPMEYIRMDNLPLPVFFQWDDVDYGIRNKAPLILMNGICLWHDPFESKRSAMYTYYSNRNPLIVNCCHDGGMNKKQVLKRLKKCMLAEICLYRYNHAEALLKAMEDFLKGPKWLCSINPDAYNKEILKLNNSVSYIADQVDYDWYLVGKQIDDCDLLHRIVRILTLNGYLLRANREIMLPLYAEKPVQGYRATRILFYEINTGIGYWANKDMKKAFSCFIRYCIISLKMRISYSKIKREYIENFKYMTSLEMWKEYLKIS